MLVHVLNAVLSTFVSFICLVRLLCFMVKCCFIVLFLERWDDENMLWLYSCNDYRPRPHTLYILLTIHFSAGRWSTSGPRWVTHISCHYKNTIGGQEKIKQTNKHEQCLGLTQEQKDSYATLCIPDSIYGLTLAWVTSENSTKQLECRLILTQSYSLDTIFSATVSRVDRICPWFHANCLIFVAASHQIRLDTRSKARRPIKVGIKGRGGRERAETRTLLVSAAHRLT